MNMTVSDRIAALIRTIVPALYGVAITFLIGRFPVIQDGLHWLSTTLGTDASAAIQLFITALVIAGYYWVARKLGARFPVLEKWLLGSSLIPTYATTTTLVVGKDTGFADPSKGINE
jgi:hypothetical protein